MVSNHLELPQENIDLFGSDPSFRVAMGRRDQVRKDHGQVGDAARFLHGFFPLTVVLNDEGAQLLARDLLVGTVQVGVISDEGVVGLLLPIPTHLYQRVFGQHDVDELIEADIAIVTAHGRVEAEKEEVCDRVADHQPDVGTALPIGRI